MKEVRFKDWCMPEFDERGMTKWGWICVHREKFKLGHETDIGFGTYINAQFGVEIGDKVQIGAGCRIYSISTIDGRYGKVVIKEGACIGANSVVLPGVVIGRNSIVGALSLVNRDIPPNEIWVGAPIRKLKDRVIE